VPIHSYHFARNENGSIDVDLVKLKRSW